MYFSNILHVTDGGYHIREQNQSSRIGMKMEFSGVKLPIRHRHQLLHYHLGQKCPPHLAIGRQLRSSKLKKITRMSLQNTISMS